MVNRKLNKRKTLSLFLISLALLSAVCAVPVSAVDTEKIETLYFPTADDIWNIASYPYMWHAGDYVEGTRDLGFLALLVGIDIHVELSYNILSGTGYVDIEVHVNDVYVGSFTVLPGDTAVDVSFRFVMLARRGEVQIKYLETNTVDPGMGSITIDDTMSTVTLKGFWF